MMINDERAENLEKKGLYRRAADRWMNVMFSGKNDAERDWIKTKRDQCIRAAREKNRQPD
ncbi:TPA: PerC family transcriptional regulator [Citrobacter freundii]|nr:PerC family transcriptional regulator [Citrobacter freundii]